MRRCAPLFATTLLLSTTLNAAPSFNAARLSEDVKTLSSDSFEGRAPATAAETKTVDFISRQMKAAGLQPGGTNGAWTQNVPLLKSDIVGAPSLSMTIGGAARPLSQGNEIAVRAALTGQDRVDLKAAPLVFVG